MAIKKSIGEASVKISGDSKGLQKELKKSQSGIQKFKSTAIAGFKGVAIGIGVATAAIGAMMIATERALGKLDKIGKSAKNIGLTAEAFQTLAFAADQSGIGVDLFQKSMAKMEKAAEDAKDGLSTAVRAFDKMGISVNDLRGANPEQLLNMLANGISGIKDPVQRAAIAMQLFGTKGLDMLEFLKDGSVGIDNLRQKALDLGLVLSNELIAAAEDNNDKLSQMKQIVDVQWLQVWADLAPAVLTVSEAFANLAKKATDVFGLGPDKTGLDSFDEAIEEVTSKMERLRDVATTTLFGFDTPAAKQARDELVQLERLLITLKKQRDDMAKLPESKPDRGSGGTGGSPGSGDPEISKAELLIQKQRERNAEIQTTIEKLDELFFAEKISADEYEAAMEKVQKTTEKVGETAKDTTEKIKSSTTEVSQLQGITNNAVDQLGRSLSQAASNGKLDFQDMFQSIIAGAIRAQLQVALIGNASSGGITGGGGLLGGIVQAGIGLFGGGVAQPGQSNFIGPVQPGRAGGGRVFAGRSYTVGELRAERFRPDVNGTIDANPSAGGNTGGNIKVVVNNSGQAKSAQVTKTSVGKDIIINVVLDDLEANGTLARRFGTTFGVTRK